MREGTPPRQTPLAEQHRKAGAKMVPFAGWELPVQYAGIMTEHRAVRSAAGLFDVSHMGEIRVSGDGAESLLQRLTPNDVDKLTPGRIHYSGLLTEQGTYLDDILVYRLGATEFLLVVNASNAEKNLDWLASRTGSENGVEIEDVSRHFALLALQGPISRGILEPLTDIELGSLGYYRFAHGQVAGVPALVSRTGYTGELGYEIYLAPEDAPRVWDGLFEEGESKGLLPAGLGARDTLRLEAGMALYGHEIDEDTTPLEAGLQWTVKWDKGPFVGREALVAQREQGVSRKLVGFEVEGRGIARQGHRVCSAGKGVGEVRSGTYSPTLEKALGTAFVPPSLSEPGTDLEVEVRARVLEARVVPLPFYRRPSAG